MRADTPVTREAARLTRRGECAKDPQTAAAAVWTAQRRQQLTSKVDVVVLGLVSALLTLGQIRGGISLVGGGLAVIAGAAALALSMNDRRQHHAAARCEGLNTAFLEERGLPLPARPDRNMAYRIQAGNAGIDDGRAL